MPQSVLSLRIESFGLLCGFLISACTQSSTPASSLTASEHTHFTVRGRLEFPSVSYAVDPAGAPVGEQILLEACEAASAVWNQTHLVEVQLAENETPDLLVSFQRDVHGACTPFGRSTVLAHTGPCGANNYLHLDGDRDWTSDPSLLKRVLAHEFGHALGLGHSLDPVALMHTEDHPSRTAPQASDLAGLFTLYGGGTDSGSDLAIVPGDCQTREQPVTILRGVAPRKRSDAACFDTQGDGILELLVWRTDDEGQGELTVYSLNKEFGVTATFGPLYGLCPPGSAIRFGVTATGERLLVRVQAGDSVHALRFDKFGSLRQRSQANFVLSDLADADGDGKLDAPLVHAPEGAPCLFEVDLNQDGKLESIVRLSGTLAR